MGRDFIMKKTYKLENLECANCAAKMEAAIRKLPGVTSASISFMAQKLTIEAEEKDLDAILNEAEKICRRFERDCSIKR